MKTHGNAGTGRPFADRQERPALSPNCIWSEAVGATTGGIVGGLIGLGIPEIEAKRYDEKLRKGNVLISVHTEDGDEASRAKDIFKNAGAEDISTISEASVAKR